MPNPVPGLPLSWDFLFSEPAVGLMVPFLVRHAKSPPSYCACVCGCCFCERRSVCQQERRIRQRAEPFPAEYQPKDQWIAFCLLPQEYREKLSPADLELAQRMSDGGKFLAGFETTKMHRNGMGTTHGGALVTHRRLLPPLPRVRA
jgi:hypothetical protein